MVKRTEAYITPDNAADRTAAWLREVRGSVRPRPNLQLDPSSAALVIVDMVNYFAATQGEAFLPASEATLVQLQRLLPVWREAGGAVVFTRHGHDGPHDTGMLGRFFSDYISWGTPASELVSQLTPAPQDVVIRKRTYDAFHETELQETLRDRAIDQVLIGGVLTHMCCA